MRAFRNACVSDTLTFRAMHRQIMTLPVHIEAQAMKGGSLLRNNEDYLDSLLNNVTKKLSEFDEDFEQKKQAADPYMTRKNLPPKTMKALESVRENQFLREFENELDRDNEDPDRFLEEFESELQDEAQEFEQTKEAQRADNDDTYMDQVEQLVSQSQKEPQIDHDPLDSVEMQADGQEEESDHTVNMDQLSDLAPIDDAAGTEDTADHAGDDFDQLPEGMEALGDLFTDDGKDDSLGDLQLPDDNQEETLLPEDGDGELSDDDIMKLLNGGGDEDEALSDIGKMLEADDQSISLEDLGAEPENLSHAADAVEQSQAQKQPKEKKKKNGFFAKLMDLLFGEDDDETPDNEYVAEADSLEGISDENMEILRAMNGDMAPETDDGKAGKKGRKKAKKEKKKKEPKPKKEKKPKEPKPKKEKKPKKPKEAGPKEKPLPRGPVIMIWLMAFSVFVLVMTGNHLLTQGNAIRTAQERFDSGDYVGSYGALAGVKLGEGDQELYERAQTLASVQEELDAYYPLMEVRKFDLALDCLVRTVGRADLHMPEAEEWGVTTQMNALITEATQQLKDQFNVTEEQARELYAINSRDEYSLALDQVLQELGLK